MRARGFLLGGTADAPRCLNGEGLQHEDGHSQSFVGVPKTASPTIPVRYEVAVIVQDGPQAHGGKTGGTFYTTYLMNENYPHRACRTEARGDLQGEYHALGTAAQPTRSSVQLLGF